MPSSYLRSTYCTKYQSTLGHYPPDCQAARPSHNEHPNRYIERGNKHFDGFTPVTPHSGRYQDKSNSLAPADQASPPLNVLNVHHSKIIRTLCIVIHSAANGSHKRQQPGIALSIVYCSHHVALYMSKLTDHNLVLMRYSVKWQQ